MKNLALMLMALACAAPVFAGDFPKGSPPFLHDYATALSTAKGSGKPVILVFSAVWCPPCQAMKKSVYPSAEVKPFHDKFVWAYLDVDQAANETVAKQFRVEGIPHIEFLNLDGKALDKQVGASSAKEFSQTLARVLGKAGK